MNYDDDDDDPQFDITHHVNLKPEVTLVRREFQKKLL